MADDLTLRQARLSEAKRALLERRLQGKRVVETAGAIPRRPVDAVVPLSSAQERLWFVDQLDPGNTSFNIPALLRLEGPLNRAALEDGLNQVVRRHEVLRTTFEAIDGQPIQVVHPSAAVPLPLDDLSSLPEGTREQEALRLAAEEAARPFDLSSGPCLRMRLLRLADDHHLLNLTVHHIVFDEWSVALFLRELIACYVACGRRPGDVAPGASDPVRGLRRLAARVAQGRRARAAAGLLEAAPDGCAPHAGDADRSPAQGGADLRRRGRHGGVPAIGGRRAQGARAQRRRDALHGPLRRLAAAASPLHRPGSDCRQLGSGQPGSPRDRITDRMSHQHRRDARRSRREPELPQRAASRPRGGARRLLASGAPVRGARSGHSPRTGSQPSPVQPVDGRAVERADRVVERAGTAIDADSARELPRPSTTCCSTSGKTSAG